MTPIFLLLLSLGADSPPVMANGCELECCTQEHPKTAILTCPVNPQCPHVDGVATLTVWDQQPGTAEPNKPAKHMAKSASPCGCITTTPVCACIASGTYKGTTTNYLSTYELPCSESEWYKPPVKASVVALAPPAVVASPPAAAEQSIGDLQTQLTADIAAFKLASGSLATAQQQIAALQSTIGAMTVSASTAQAKIAADMEAINAALGIKPVVPPTPIVPPGPAPTPTPTVSILVVGATYCTACHTELPVITALAASGMKISYVEGDTDGSIGKYALTTVPTHIVLLDGKEVTRYVGVLNKAQLTAWMAACQEHAKTHVTVQSWSEK